MATRKQAKAEAVYSYALTVTPSRPTDDIDPGSDSAVLANALAHGLRPVGEAKVSKIEDHADGVSKIVTWTVPVEENV